MTRAVLAWVALAVVYVVWGSTYLAIRVGVRDLPPGILAGARYFLAGLILYPAAIRTGAAQLRVADRPRRTEWMACAVVAILLLVRSAIGTLVERSTRYTMLVHLPREEGYRHKQTIKNGPALAGYGAITMKNALAKTMTTLPEQLRRSLTWDRGKELSAHAQFKVETGIPVFFADPRSPWQRGSNENANGLLRQYFPNGTDLSRWSDEEIQAVAAAFNNRPRKTSDGRHRLKPSTSNYP